jgi:glycosyltransferase involved in cell wall biosynthesis
MQRLPGIETQFKKYFPLYPSAFRSFGTVRAKTLWVSASTFAKCLPFTSRTASVLYCHNPTRFLWQAGEEYVDTEVLAPVANRVVRTLVPWLRGVDYKAAQAFDIIVANSEAVRKRIAHIYRRDALVIHPPVQLDRFTPSANDDGYYVVVSRLSAYKAIDRAVVACSRSGRRLIVVGEGPDRERLEGLAGSTVSFTGWASDAEVQRLMERSKALIFPAEEDFGIAPVEAQACGKPVIAYARGGALETVVEGETGCFFQDRTADSLLAALERAERITWNPALIRQNAERFSEERFHQLTDEAIAQAAATKRERVAERRELATHA